MPTSSKMCLGTLLLCFLLLAEVHGSKKPLTLSEKLSQVRTYAPDWKDLDARPNPDWYDESKIGIFIHWGVFSVPAYACGAGAEWYWWALENTNCTVEYHNKAFGPNFKYADFGPMFKATLFDPVQWANLFEKSGAKYVVLTSKHHEGFCNFPSPQAWNWNSVSVGPGRDLVKELTDAVRNSTDLKMGLYHSLFEWYHPLWLSDQANNFTTTRYVKEVLTPQLYQVVNDYKPAIVWSDGDWLAPDTYWKSKEFIAWLYNESPVKDEVVVNDRWGEGDRNKHGGFWTGDDRYNPGHLLPHKWENCMTIDSGSWGFNQNSGINDYLTIEQLLYEVVTSVSCGGNILINVGPTANGDIAPVFQERLLQMGSWLKINGKGIYSSLPWRQQNETLPVGEVWYTEGRSNEIYAFLTAWPKNDQVSLKFPIPSSSTATIQMLGWDQKLSFSYDNNAVTVTLPSVPISELPCDWIWTLRLDGFK